MCPHLVSRARRRGLAALSLLAALCAGGWAAAPEQAAIARYAAAIRGYQTSDGAITMGPAGKGDKVVPYFANLAAMGLVASYQHGRDRKDLDAARRWADFYRARMRPDGTVYDLTGRAGDWTVTEDADSTDSYAATYLSLLEAITEATNDTAWLKARYASVEGAVRAMRLTLQPNGLTTAKPSWPVMYTMDNVEVWRGFSDAARLARRIQKHDDARAWDALADGTRRALGTHLWNSKGDAYLVGIQTDGGREDRLSAWYPDVMANLMALGWGPSDKRHPALYRRLWDGFGKDLPRAARTEDDLDRLVWWGFAAQAEKDAPRARAIATRLAGANLKAISAYNPALLGHAARLLSAAGAAEQTPMIEPSDGMVLTRSVRLKPGVYVLPKGIVLGADGVTLDGSGATLIGSGEGQAVRVAGHKNVTVKNLRAARYRWGIRVEGGENVTVRDCHIRETAEVEPPDEVWLNIWAGPDDAYGAAILMLNVQGGLVAENDVQHQQNGVSLYGCTGVTVEKNNASFQSGWGIHLYSSSRNIVQDNLADWCNRIHKRGERDYYPGADAAGLLMIWNSSHNVIRRNMFRGGGDGVFVAGYHPDHGRQPCNDNLFEGNDGSYSPNNAFEATFSRGNVFRDNRANASNYGFWLGYSWENLLEENEVRGNRIAGIAIEHGRRNEIARNQIFRNARGIALWSRSDAPFAKDFPEARASAWYDIRENVVYANGVGLFSNAEGDAAEARPHDYTLRGNTFFGNGTGLLAMRTDGLILEGNRFQENAEAGLRLEDAKGARATRNAFVGPGGLAWSDTPVTWTEGRAKDGIPEGNYWSSGPGGGPARPDGPNPGADTAPLAKPPMPLEPAYPTERALLRVTPR